MKPIKVPNIVKEKMFMYLKGDCNGTNRALDVEEDFTDTWKLDTHTERILVFHIATNLCDNEATKSIVNSDHDYQVASCLSRYCVYLVMARPELIGTDRPEWISKIVMDVAKKFGGNNDDVCKEDTPTATKLVVDKGRELAARLMDERIDEKQRWAMLAGAWIKMVLHLAASGDVKAHISTVGHGGGEFLTHVWALLSHIGQLPSL